MVESRKPTEPTVRKDDFDSVKLLAYLTSNTFNKLEVFIMIKSSKSKIDARLI